MTDTATALAPKGWRVSPEGAVPVADVVRSAGVSHSSVDYVVRLGLVDVVDQRGTGRRRYISVEDGLLIMAAAALAVAAGVALAAMFRAVKAQGATVTPGNITIPLNLAA